MNLELPEGTHVQILIAPAAATPMLLEPYRPLLRRRLRHALATAC